MQTQIQSRAEHGSKVVKGYQIKRFVCLCIRMCGGKKGIGETALTKKSEGLEWESRQVVLTVLDLLAVTLGLLEGLDHHGGGRGADLDASLAILDDELAGDAKSLPVEGGLGDVFTDLLGGLENKRRSGKEKKNHDPDSCSKQLKGDKSPSKGFQAKFRYQEVRRESNIDLLQFGILFSNCTN